MFYPQNVCLLVAFKLSSTFTISHTTGQKYQDREIIARRSKGSNPSFGSTPVKSTIWSQGDQKDRFVIFAHGALKMGKKSWRETFGTIGVKVWSLSRSKFRKFDPWSHHKRTEHKITIIEGWPIQNATRIAWRHCIATNSQTNFVQHFSTFFPTISWIFSEILLVIRIV